MFPNKRITIASLAVGAAVFILITALLLIIRDLRLRAEADDVADSLLQRLESIASEATQALTTLNNYGYSRCNDSTLLSMRQQLYLTPYIVDIGFLDGDLLLCTTGAGVLTEPIDSGPPSYIGQMGGEVRIRPRLKLLMFESRYMNAVLLRHGRFNAILDPSRLDTLDSPYIQWEAVYTGDSEVYRMAGTEGIYQQTEPKSFLFNNYFSKCSNVLKNHCMAIKINPGLELAHRRLEIAIVVALSLALSVAAGVLFQHSMNSRRSVRRRVKRGVDQGSVYWLYQPIVDMTTGEVVGCEALARFRDSFGVLTPDIFIPSLREQELTWHFTELMVRTILTELEPIKAFPSGFRFSINMCPFDIEQGHIKKLPELPGLAESRFNFSLEVTEDEYLDSPVAHEYLEYIAQQGYGVAIDDFGTGYSNLKTLTMLRFDYLKIDRSFVKDIETKGLKVSVIPQIMDIARKFGLQVIAEGVETDGQHEILQSLGVQYGQGWRYGKPMTPDVLASVFSKKG